MDPARVTPTVGPFWVTGVQPERFKEQCIECARIFDLLDGTDADEWANGHDCEVTGRDPIEIYGTPEHEFWLIEMESREP